MARTAERHGLIARALKLLNWLLDHALKPILGVTRPAPPVRVAILIGGFGMSSCDFFRISRFIHALVAKRRFIVRYLSYRPSEDPPNFYTAEEAWKLDVGQLAAKLTKEIEHWLPMPNVDFLICGHSFGGLAAVQWAQDSHTSEAILRRVLIVTIASPIFELGSDISKHPNGGRLAALLADYNFLGVTKRARMAAVWADNDEFFPKYASYAPPSGEHLFRQASVTVGAPLAKREGDRIHNCVCISLGAMKEIAQWVDNVYTHGRSS